MTLIQLVSRLRRTKRMGHGRCITVSVLSSSQDHSNHRHAASLNLASSDVEPGTRCLDTSLDTISPETCPRGLSTRGFTLIELMIVVVIIGILASLAITMFGSEQKKINAKSEVTGMFGEFKMRQEQYRLENGKYLSTGGFWPSSPNGNGGRSALLPFPTGSNWLTLHMAPDASSVYCSYKSVAGLGGDASTIGSAGTSFGFTAPPTDWYYIVAECDMDQDSTVNSFYFQTSGDSELYYKNQGK